MPCYELEKKNKTTRVLAYFLLHVLKRHIRTCQEACSAIKIIYPSSGNHVINQHMTKLGNTPVKLITKLGKE